VVTSFQSRSTHRFGSFSSTTEPRSRGKMKRSNGKQNSEREIFSSSERDRNDVAHILAQELSTSATRAHHQRPQKRPSPPSSDRPRSSPIASTRSAAWRPTARYDNTVLPAPQHHHAWHQVESHAPIQQRVPPPVLDHGGGFNFAFHEAAPAPTQHTHGNFAGEANSPALYPVFYDMNYQLGPPSIPSRSQTHGARPPFYFNGNPANTLDRHQQRARYAGTSLVSGAAGEQSSQEGVSHGRVPPLRSLGPAAAAPVEASYGSSVGANQVAYRAGRYQNIFRSQAPGAVEGSWTRHGTGFEEVPYGRDLSQMSLGLAAAAPEEPSRRSPDASNLSLHNNMRIVVDDSFLRTRPLNMFFSKGETPRLGFPAGNRTDTKSRRRAIELRGYY